MVHQLDRDISRFIRMLPEPRILIPFFRFVELRFLECIQLHFHLSVQTIEACKIGFQLLKSYSPSYRFRESRTQVRRDSVSYLPPLASLRSYELIDDRESHKGSYLPYGRKAVFTVSFPVIFRFIYERFSRLRRTGSHYRPTWPILVFGERHLPHIGMVLLQISGLVPFYDMDSCIIEMVRQFSPLDGKTRIVRIGKNASICFLLGKIRWRQPIENLSQRDMVPFVRLFRSKEPLGLAPFSAYESQPALRRPVISGIEDFSITLDNQSRIARFFSNGLRPFRKVQSCERILIFDEILRIRHIFHIPDFQLRIFFMFFYRNNTEKGLDKL